MLWNQLIRLLPLFAGGAFALNRQVAERKKLDFGK
jgi:hypothetical protein